MRTRPVVAVFLLYLALTVAMTWPLAIAPASFVPADPGDPLPRGVRPELRPAPEAVLRLSRFDPAGVP